MKSTLEEMSQLYLPWAVGERRNCYQNRSQFASNLELHKTPYEHQEPIHRQRSPSLPPINHVEQMSSPNKEESRRMFNRNIPSAKRFSFYDEDGEGDTSGYGSETVNHMSIMNQRNFDVNERSHNPVVVAWQNDNRNNPSSGGRSSGAEGPWSQRTPRSAAEEGRPRWGDRGVATGRLWEPTAPTARLPQMQNEKKGTPSWVERGLNMIDNATEVLVIDQGSSSNSGADCDRSSTNDSDEARTFLRGQNVPLEPEVKAQRENKRIKALELQSALASQLEDREKRRQDEKEKKLREERLEELRIQRQREEDRLREEQERKKHEEKLLQEQCKLDALQRALENAEKLAKQDKEKRFNYHKSSVDSDVRDKTKLNIENHEANEHLDRLIDNTSSTKSNRTYDLNSANSNKNESHSNHTSEQNSPRSVASKDLNLFIHSVPPIALPDNQFNFVPIAINGDVVASPSSNIQFAVLVPQSLNNNLYSLSLNSLNNNNELIDTTKVLTPSKYRITRTKDASTQTEPGLCNSNEKMYREHERNIDKNYANIDENAPQDTLKKDRRFRSEERYKKDLENRPKWGVNRPVAQYKKQSEKDPFYSQKRKIRPKHRPQVIQYLSQSSDDSRSPSPPTRSDKIENCTKQRNSLSQCYWRNKRSSQDFTKTSICETVNVVATDTKSFEQVNTEITENKISPKMSPTKRMTLSQKFINDKYGNRKLWIDEVNDRNLKNNTFDAENRKKIIDQINAAKKDLFTRSEERENVLLKTKY